MMTMMTPSFVCTVDGNKALTTHVDWGCGLFSTADTSNCIRIL